MMTGPLLQIQIVDCAKRGVVCSKCLDIFIFAAVNTLILHTECIIVYADERIMKQPILTHRRRY